MTSDELDDILDSMNEASASSGEPGRSPGLITVESSWWVAQLSAVRATCSALHDGLRYREVQIHAGSSFETQVLSRDDAGERGTPYRDLTLRPIGAGSS